LDAGYERVEHWGLSNYSIEITVLCTA
jgi:hypothetical protein